MAVCVGDDAGRHIRLPSAATRVLGKESQLIPPIQQLCGSALMSSSACNYRVRFGPDNAQTGSSRSEADDRFSYNLLPKSGTTTSWWLLLPNKVSGHGPIDRGEERLGRFSHAA